ncbi:MAG TPA: hypothetical protein VEX66_06885 [Microlunatus sp.]|nr:hypothetical protein [Microlunatus sp.]
MVDVPDFDALYRQDPDPWGVASSFYERRKLQIVLAAFVTQLRPISPGLGPVVPPSMLAHDHEQLLVLPDQAVAS